ncbi:MAG: 30S ribosomal protein S20 [Armatimonadaceae bacterium]
MPNIKSVAKDVIRSRSRRLRNNATKSRIKTAIKKTHSAIVSGDAAAVTTAMSLTVSIVDRAAKRGIIHKNAANRRKSRLMKRAAAAAA